jgi:signal transduction histidine kinase
MISTENCSIEGQEAITIAIEDSGPGISESMREKMFQPFSTEGKVNGTGLGLTLALLIALEHGGSLVLASSEPGRTVFHLTLPLAPPRPKGATEGDWETDTDLKILQTRSES